MPTPVELRQRLLAEVNRSLRTDGLTRDKFLEVKIKDGKYVTDLSRIHTKIGPETEDLLRKKIAETGQTVTEFMLEIIINALSQSN